MIYQPRNVQPSSTAIDATVDNTFSMEMQTNSYVSAYQLSIIDFNNNDIYNGDKISLDTNLYNGDILQIPVKADSSSLSNGNNYKWRVKLYQPSADMLITYGLVQSTSTKTNVYLQPNINIKSGMVLNINNQSKTISSYNVSTGLAVVSSAFSSTPSVGTQYYIYSDFIETTPDYIFYARKNPTVSISNVPSTLTLKYHTFQGTYVQDNNVPIVYHKFDLYIQNSDGSKTLINTSDKVYSANLSYTYDAFRTGSTYSIQMTIENDMGIVTKTELYSFDVSYDIVEYLQQPQASFNDKQNAVQISWVTPVENNAVAVPLDVAKGQIQSNDNTVNSAFFEPEQIIAQGDMIRLTNSDFNIRIDGGLSQETTTGKQMLQMCAEVREATGLTFTKNIDGSVTLDGTATEGTFCNLNTSYSNLDDKKYFTLENGKTYTMYCKNISSNMYFVIRSRTQNGYLLDISDGNELAVKTYTKTTDEECYGYLYVPAGSSFDNYTVYPMVCEGAYTELEWEPYTGGEPSPSPDYPQEITTIKDSVKLLQVGKNLFNKNGKFDYGNNNKLTLLQNDGTIITTANFSNNRSAGQLIDVEQNINYNVSGILISSIGTAPNNVVIQILDINNQLIKMFEISKDVEKNYNFSFNFNSSNNRKIWISLNARDFDLSAKVEAVFDKIQIEKGNVATSFEPYKEKEYTIDLQGNELSKLTDDIKDNLLIDSSGNVTIEKNIRHLSLAIKDMDGSSTYPGWNNMTTLKEDYPGINDLFGSYAVYKSNITNNQSAIAINTYLTNAKLYFIRSVIPLTQEEWIAQYSDLTLELYYNLKEPEIINLGKILPDGSTIFNSIDGKTYIYIGTTVNTNYELIYSETQVSNPTNVFTQFNPSGKTQTVTINSYNRNNGYAELMSNSEFVYIPVSGDNYQVIGNIYNSTGFQILYNTPYNSVNSLYTHGYTTTWAAQDGLCILPDNFNITLQFSPDNNFYYNDDGYYQEIVDLITTTTDDSSGAGSFSIKIDKNKLLFIQNPDINLELPFYTNTVQVFVLSPNSTPQINNDYIWDDDGTWNDTYVWVEGGTSIERICNHWWKVQITNTYIKIEEIFPTA